MKRYRFPLEAVRRVRTSEQDRAAAELGLAQREAAVAAQRAEDRRRSYDATPRPEGRLAVAELTAGLTLLRLAADAVAHARVVQSEAEVVVDARRTDWTDARSRVKALDSLDDRLKARHAAEAERLERIEVDDLVNSRRKAVSA